MSDKIPMPQAPEGYEWKEGESSTHNNYILWDRKYYHASPKQKRYDHGKTAGYVLCHSNRVGYSTVKRELDSDLIEIDTKQWYAHLGGPCPFDPDAVIVEIRHRNGQAATTIAGHLTWEHYNTMCDIIAVRFVKLAEDRTW